jgi:acylphosphatase
MTAHKVIRIRGTVQGVSFRYYAAEEARRLRLCGFIRNEPDGSVYAEAEGPLPHIEQFIYWAREGPRGALVEHIEVTEGTPKGYGGFSIRR